MTWIVRIKSISYFTTTVAELRCSHPSTLLPLSVALHSKEMENLLHGGSGVLLTNEASRMICRSQATTLSEHRVMSDRTNVPSLTMSSRLKLYILYESILLSSMRKVTSVSESSRVDAPSVKEGRRLQPMFQILSVETSMPKIVFRLLY